MRHWDLRASGDALQRVARLNVKNIKNVQRMEEILVDRDSDEYAVV